MRNSVLAPVCAGLGTHIEFDLKNHKGWDRLVRKSRNSRQTLVVFEGEFYGAPVVNPKQPEATRTKMVVYSILSVKALPRYNPCAPPKYDRTQFPCFQGDLVAQKGDTPDRYPPARLRRQSVLGKPVPHPEVPPGVPGPLRVHSGQSCFFAGVFSLVQPGTPPLRAGLTHAGH